MKKLFLFIAGPLILYFLVFKVNVIYESIGIRIESMIMNLFGESNALDGNSYLMRQQIKSIAFNFIKQAPLFGNGLNSMQMLTGYGTENNLLQIMVEFGIFGTLVYYSFLIPLIFDILKTKKKNVFISMFSVLILAILMQDYGSVTYSWQHITMWYSVFWAVYNIENGSGHYLKLR